MRTPLRKTVVWLRRHFPAKKPVMVLVCKSLPGMHGVCLLHEERAIIKICRSAEQMMAETLLEEWAHLLRDECPIPHIEGDEHDALFWAILAAITKEYRGE
jgi:hypothetical protein